jgi:hypothetical protein
MMTGNIKKTSGSMRSSPTGIFMLLTLVEPDCVITRDASLPSDGRHVDHDGMTPSPSDLSGMTDSAVTEPSDPVGGTKWTVRANRNAGKSWLLRSKRLCRSYTGGQASRNYCNEIEPEKRSDR